MLHLKGAMSTISELKTLNDSFENEKMVAKLPDFMIVKWAEVIRNKRISTFCYPSFHEFVHFVNGHAETMSEPVMLLRCLDNMNTM